MKLILPAVRSASAALAVALVVASVAGELVPALREALLLVPDLVLGRLFLWQLATYGLFERSPMGVIFGALILWSLGGAVEARWGRRRFLTFSLGVVAAAGVATVALAALAPSLVASSYAGGAVFTLSLWVAYGLSIGRGQTNFWGLPVTGDVLALIGAGFVLLDAVYGGVRSAIPSLFALAFTYLWVRGGSPMTRLRSWQLERDLRRRSSHLRSVEGGRRSPPRDRDQFLN
jgi:membrane associated rhomboid family serine protease